MLMNLVSCDGCGLVYDTNKLYLAKEKESYLEDGSLDYEKFAWNGDEYVPYFNCPVCHTDVLVC